MSNNRNPTCINRFPVCTGRRLAVVVGALLLLPMHARAQDASQEVMKRFRTAPQETGQQELLLTAYVNKVSSGLVKIKASDEHLVIPAEAARALRLKGGGKGDITFDKGGRVSWILDAARGNITIDIPPDMLGVLDLTREIDASLRLSPEKWGAWVDYDLNLRRPLYGPGKLSYGGLLGLTVSGPDVLLYQGAAVDGSGSRNTPVIRLDTTAIWRPSDENVSVSLGDSVSAQGDSARSWRFGGILAGTDYGSTPGFSTAPVTRITGTAAAQSSIDLLVNGQRISGSTTSGGPFSLTIPGSPGAPGTGLVVTDVTGRIVVIPVGGPRVDAGLIREGLTLWSAGIGVPRFDWGTPTSSYGKAPYAFGSARHGLSERVTVNGHIEGGMDLFEAEAGASASATSWLAVKGSASGSKSARGVGARFQGAVIITAPWHLGMDASYSRSIGPFDDVVSVTGRAHNRGRQGVRLEDMSRSALTARISWNPSPLFGISASISRYVYADTGAAGVVALTAQTMLTPSIPVFASFTHALGGSRDSAILVGISFPLGGDVQGSVAAGPSQGSWGGSVSAVSPLSPEQGSVGWRVLANRNGGNTFATSEADVRTGYGIVGAGVDWFGKQTTGNLFLRGSAGIAGSHPFVSDPITGGLVVADAGSPGAEVRANGYTRGVTGYDGKLVLDTDPGIPVVVSLGTEKIDLSKVPENTEGTTVVRRNGVSVITYGVRDTSHGAVVVVLIQGSPPPVGSTLSGANSSAPMDARGRAYLTAITNDEVLLLETVDGKRCRVETHFDGKGGPGRRIGPLSCGPVG